MDTLRNVMSYMTEDEQLQLSAAPALLLVDRSAAHLDSDLSVGGPSFVRDPLLWRSHQHMALNHVSHGMRYKIHSACCAGLWGLDRLDGRSPRRDFMYTYDADGTGVHIYVIDTVTHPYL